MARRLKRFRRFPEPPPTPVYFSPLLVKPHLVWYISAMSEPPAQHGLILASASPRRKYLLEQAGLRFTVKPSRVDEDALDLADAPPAVRVRLLAEAKARDVADRHPESWVLGADTLVFNRNAALGKPGSDAEARQMLSVLSGQTHQVVTGYALRRRASGQTFSDAVSTRVTFKALSDMEIEWYIRTREPFDKAGAYAIQGIGTFLVRRIEGSYTNVVGLPVCEVIELMLREGIVGLSPEDRGRLELKGD